MSAFTSSWVGSSLAFKDVVRLKLCVQNVDCLGMVVCGMMFRIQVLTHIQTVIHTVLIE